MIQLLMILLPGFIAVEIYRKFFPAVKFRWLIYTGWVVINGVLIWSLLVSIEERIYNTSWGLLDGTGSFLGILFLFILGVIAGLIRVVFRMTGFKLAKNLNVLRWLKPEKGSIWMNVNEKNGGNEWVIVYLSDGSIYLGWVSQFANHPERTNQEFVLQNARRLDEAHKQLYEIVGAGVYLNTRDVMRIEFWSSELI